MDQQNNQPQFEVSDVDGISITVEKVNKKKDFPPLPVDEWLLAKILEVKKQTPFRKDWKPSLGFTFQISHDDERFNNQRIWYNTALSAVPGSRLYVLYAKVMGLPDVLPDGINIKLSDFRNKTCFIMVGNSATKPGKQVIVNIKRNEGHKDDVAQVQKVIAVAAKKQEIKVTPKSEIVDDFNLENINVDDL